MLVAAAALSGIGCEQLHNAGVPGLEHYVKPDPVNAEKSQSARDKYMVHRDHKSLYWLMANRISNGMELHEVNEVLGEEGEQTNEFSTLKSDGLYQATDTVYKWGPDDQGYTAVLFFRDRRVVNFNPKNYQLP